MSGMDSNRRSVQSSAVTEWNDGKVRSLSDLLAGEEPLLIQVADRALTMTMRIPGDDFELAVNSRRVVPTEVTFRLIGEKFIRSKLWPLRWLRRS